MTLYNMVDAATPGASLPAGTHILAAYVGIPNQYGPDTPHIWTRDEWNEYLDPDRSLKCLPIYTHNYPGNAKADADNAVQAVGELGWVDNKTGEDERIIAVDLEIFVDPGYVSALFMEIRRRGFSPMPYGSDFYVKQNPAGIGYWSALLTPRAPSMLPSGYQGIQWSWTHFPGWDSSVVSQRVWDGCGIGPRN